MLEQEKINNISSNKTSSETKVEKLIEEYLEHIESIRELAEMGYFAEGDSYDFEKMIDEDWGSFSPEEMEQVLRGIGTHLGVELVNIREEEVLRREFREGTPGGLDEEGADVTVLKTEDEMFEVHIHQYRNSSVGTRYDILRAK